MRSGRQVSIAVPSGRAVAGVATVNPTSNGVTPVAVLACEGFDAAALDVSTLRFGPGKVAPKANGVSRRDADGDGTRDLVVKVPTQEMGIRSGDTSLCMTGVANDGESFRGCDGIRQVPAG